MVVNSLELEVFPITAQTNHTKIQQKNLSFLGILENAFSCDVSRETNGTIVVGRNINDYLRSRVDNSQVLSNLTFRIKKKQSFKGYE